MAVKYERGFAVTAREFRSLVCSDVITRVMITLACIRNMLFIANNNNKIMRPKPIVPSLKFPVPRIVEPKPEKIPYVYLQCSVELVMESSIGSYSCFQTVYDKFTPGGFAEEIFFRRADVAEKSKSELAPNSELPR